MECSRINTADAEASSSQSRYGETRPLNLGCKIYISHSLRDKNFVRHLHDKLVHLYGYAGMVFFDERSLPAAEPISMEKVLDEARGCQLGVLVLAEDFFVHTPNQMLELETLVTSNVRLLPLFFKMSVDEFKLKKRRDVWEEQWKEWLEGDEGRLKAWKHALSFVDRFIGLEYWKLANNELEFINKVVAVVAQIVPPAKPFSEEGIWGMDRLCEIVDVMYQQCAAKRASDGCTQVASTSARAGHREDNGDSLDLVGIYGFAGLGKSTLCRCLCNYYVAEYQGKVCWLDLGSVPDFNQVPSQIRSSKSAFMWRMLYFLSKLTGPIDALDYRTFYEIQNLLENWIRKKPLFLAIDNIQPDLESREEVDFYLSCKFAKGSKIFVTARSAKILEQVTREYAMFSVMIEHIPKLNFEEARAIFVQKLPKQLQISNMQDEIKECVSICVIRPEDDTHCQHDINDKWYHPSMLKSLAASVRYDTRDNLDLKSRLREFVQLATAINKSDAGKMVFDMLDIAYSMLTEEAKIVFLDLSLFYKIEGRDWRSSSYAWRQSVHLHLTPKQLQMIFCSLEDLSFIVMENSSYKALAFRMPDLMVDFAKHKARQELRANNLISAWLKDTIKEGYVTDLWDNYAKDQGPETSSRLLRAPSFSEITKEENPDSGPSLAGSSNQSKHLEITELHEDAQEPLPSHCQKLTLKDRDVHGFKFEEFPNLRKLKLQYCSSLQRLPLGICNLRALQVLSLHGCSRLQELPMEMGKLTALESLDVHACEKLKGLPKSLSRLTLLEELSLCECATLQALPDAMGELSALKTLCIADCGNLSKLPESTSKLVSLVRLELQGCTLLMELPRGMGNLNWFSRLRARTRTQLELKELSLDDCSNFQMLPSKLGNFKKLETLSLAHCHHLKALSSSICDLDSLVLLDLQGCSELEMLPDKVGMHLRALKLLYLMGCQNLRELPSSFCALKCLTELDMTRCEKLEWLPQKMGSLEALRKLKLAYCKSLCELPDSMCELGALVVMDVHGCEKLQKLPAELGKLGKLEILDLRSCKRLMSFPRVDGASEFQSLRELDLRWSFLEIQVIEKGDLYLEKGDFYFLGPDRVKDFFELWRKRSTEPDV